MVGIVGWILLQAATLPDTIVTKPLAAPTTALGTAIGIANLVVSLLLIVVVVVLVPTILGIRTAMDRIGRLLDRVSQDVSPLVQHANDIVTDVHYITASVREDVTRVGGVVRDAAERVTDALDASEERLRELGAVLDVVQDEVEGSLVAVASTLRGARAGAAVLRNGRRGRRAKRAREVDEEFDDEDVDDDDDRPRGRRPARPRVRPRRERRGAE